MRILVVTQAVDADSSTLGFFVEWLREFSGRCERVDVIALSVGRHDLPANVRVVSMGKERGIGRLGRLLAYWRHLLKLLPETDGVFIHMCPEYLLAGWPLLVFRRLPTVFWYAHRSRNLLARAAMPLATHLATSVPGAVTLAAANIRFLGQGIPTELFRPLPLLVGSPFRLVVVGRITPIKRLDLLIDALALLRGRGIDAALEFWGEPAAAGDAAYAVSLRERAVAASVSGRVRFLGRVPFARMPEKYGGVSVAWNACADGAVDKAVLEAMACARPVVVTNHVFSGTFGPDADACLADGTAESIAEKTAKILSGPGGLALGLRLRETVVAHHGLPGLVNGIIDLMDSKR